MSEIITWRNGIQKLYSRYSQIFIRIARFIFALVVINQISSNIGYMDALSSPIITIGIAVVCAFFSTHLLIVLSAGLIGAHLYSVSLAVMAITLVIFLILYVMLLRFSSKWMWLVLVVPLAFLFNIPYILPILFALIGGPVLAAPLFAGTIVFYVLQYITTSTVDYDITDAGNTQMLEAVTQFSQEILDNNLMWVMAAMLVVIFLIVYGLRRQSYPHPWKIAIGVGAVTMVIGHMMINSLFEFDIPTGVLVGSLFLSVALGLIFEFLFFNVNYAKTERLQFEDNEYYYYVKAIPKFMGDGGPPKRRRRIEEEMEDELDDLPLGDEEDSDILDTASNVTAEKSPPQDQATTVINTDQLRQSDIQKRSSQPASPPSRRRPGSPGRNPGERNQNRPGERSQSRARPRGNPQSTSGENVDDILLSRNLTRELGLDQSEEERNKN